VSAPTERRQWPVFVGLLVVLAGAATIVVIGPGQRPPLRPPDRFGVLERTPSEEVSTPHDMIATYTYGPHSAVLSVSGKDDAKNYAEACVRSSSGSQCSWSDGAFDYILVNNSSDVEATRLFAAQAQDAFKATNNL
jgi:hypothetical protein